MSATPPTITQRLSRQMQAAMHLKRRYETLFNKPISITDLRKDPEQLHAFRTEILQTGDRELLQLFDTAFADDPPAIPMWSPNAISTAQELGALRAPAGSSIERQAGPHAKPQRR